jgi:hypothetical protein
MENIATNRLALISSGAAILTGFSFCIGVAPIPLTAIVCYPASIILGLVALGTGIVALNQINAGLGQGRMLAWVGIGLGTLTMLLVLCATTITVISLPLLAKWASDSWRTVSP